MRLLQRSSHKMIPLIEKSNPDAICEWLAEFFLPKFYAKIKFDGHENLNDFLFQFNLNKNSSDAHPYDPCIKEYISDISNYMSTCVNYVERLYYIGWLFEICRPILTTLFITLFFLPVFLASLVYFSSTFLFFAKHWSKLKVNTKWNSPHI